MLKPILLVEDDKRDLELTLIALQRSRLAKPVDVVRDGAEALDYLNHEGVHAGLASGNPAAVPLDLKLPKVNGLEVLRHVRSTDSLRGVPVVMLTSSNEEADVLESHALGVDAYLVKPLDLKRLVAAIDDLDVFWAVARRSAATVDRNQPPP